MINDNDDDDRDLSIRLPLDLDPSRIKIEALQEDGNFVVKVNVLGPFNKEEQEVIDGLCEAIDEADGEDTEYMRSLN
ncbi:MAG TPA: hypothetical protein VMX17_14590 [Candidatus Glassbacteria bacterium]|nr:hypothetical protein [Candidatus Glassbacteria bacterium]